MISGETYKILRLSRRISAKKIGKALGYKSKTSCLEAEKMSNIPKRFVEVLERLTGLNLQDESVVEKLAEESAQEFTALDSRCKLWDSKYANLIEQSIVGNGGSMQYDSKGKFLL